MLNDISLLEFETNPVAVLDRCRDSLQEVSKNSKSRRENFLSHVYASYYAIKRDLKAYKDFARTVNSRNIFKNKLKMEKGFGECGVWIARYALEPTLGYNRTYKISRAFEYCDLVGVKPKEFQELLKERGIEKIAIEAFKKLPYKGRSLAARFETRSNLTRSLQAGEEYVPLQRKAQSLNVDYLNDLQGDDEHSVGNSPVLEVNLSSQELCQIRKMRQGEVAVLEIRCSGVRKTGFVDFELTAFATND